MLALVPDPAMGADAVASPAPGFQTEDVTRFYQVLEATDGAPSAAVLQDRYLDRGSAGLHELAKLRDITAEKLAAAIQKKPNVFRDARRCAQPLPQVARRVTIALQDLRARYPDALFPPVTVVIGRGNTGGTTGPSGVLIGLETICSVVTVGEEEDRLVRLIAHEYAHVQQPATRVEPDHPTLLYAAIVEGGAELVAELISGEIANPQLKKWTRGREKDIETEFSSNLRSTDLSRWLWNGPGSDERPGDLGYWVGYRITKALYVRTPDKQQALKKILTATPEEILADSGWYPGIDLDRL